MASDTPSQFRIYVKTISGERYSIEISPESTVQDLKKRLEAESGVPLATIRLIFQGKALVDSQKLGTDCKIKDENVVHMVEKSAPTDTSGAQNPGNNATSTSSPSTSLGSDPGSSAYPGGVRNGGVQGPNVVVRTIHIGIDPTGAISPNSSSNAAAQPAAGSSPTTTNPVSPAPSNNEAAAIQNMYQQIMGGLQQLFGSATQAVQGTSAAPRTGQPTTASSPAPQASATGANPGAQNVNPGPHTHTHIQVSLPAVVATRDMWSISQHLGTFENHILPQFENHVRTIANDINEFINSFHPDNGLPERTFDINIPRTAPAAPQTPNTDPNPVQGLWLRFNAVQRRWLTIVQAIEGDRPLFGTEESDRAARLVDVPMPRIAARATSNEDIPRLVLPLRHGLRHVLEHWAPQVSNYFGSINLSIAPYYHNHHSITHHPQPSSSSAPPQTGDAAAQNASSTTNARPSSAPAQTAPPTTSLPSNGATSTLNTTSSATASNNTASTALPTNPAPVAPVSTPVAQTSSTPIDASENRNSSGETGAQTQQTAKQSASSSVATAASSSAASSIDDLMREWRPTIERDLIRQAHMEDQNPFSNAYGHDYTNAATISADSQRPDRDILEEFLRTSEEAIPGALTSGLPLANSSLSPALLTSFQTHLQQLIRERLESDSDWSTLRQRGQTASRFPNLDRLMNSDS